MRRLCLLLLAPGACALGAAALAADANTGGATTLRFESGQVVVLRNETELTRALVNPDAPVKNHPGAGNAAFVVVANCFAVVREFHDFGPSCHTPPSNTIELTTLGDERKTVRFKWPKSFFQGSTFTSPAGDWGFVLSGHRTMLDGYLLLRANGSHYARPIDPPLDWTPSYGAVVFSTAGLAVFPKLKRGDMMVSLRIHQTGDFDVVPLVEGSGAAAAPAVSAPSR